MPLFILPHEGICSMLTIRVEEAIELIPNVCSPWCGKGGMTSNRLLDPSGKDISKNIDKILLNIQQEKEGTHTSSTAVGTVGSLGSSVSSAPGKWLYVLSNMLLTKSYTTSIHVSSQPASLIYPSLCQGCRTGHISKNTT